MSDPALQQLLAQACVADRLWADGRLAAIAARRARGQPVDRTVAEVTARLERSVAEVERRAALPLTITYPEHLPVSQRRDEIVAALRRHPVLVLTGETGSGKTTQLPKMLLEAGYGRRGMLAMTQPRRLAATAMAARIREECRAAEGVIAHSVRFDDRAGDDTIIRVMTDGLLLSEFANDRDLSRYDAVIIDEAHERSLNIDLLLGLLRVLRQRRPDLALVVSSASIEAERFARYLDAPTIAVEGRLYPVEIRHLPVADEDTGYLATAIDTVRGVVEGGDGGDVLVFLPTERDILEAQRRLHDLPGTAVLPLFSRLTPAEQQKVFQPPPGRLVRKVVLSTNIAETSLTIPGVRYVIDSGLARMKRYQASSRTERLPIEPISRASATQRAGRAGRVEAGVCIRLYAEDDLARRDAYTAPEILRSNLAGVLLTCLGMDISRAEEFPWLDAPAPGAWAAARTLLDELGAITSDAALRLTPLGRTLSIIPADPQVARILIAGITEGCPHEACTIAAFLSVQDPRVRPLGQEAKADSAHKALAHEAGDLASVLKLWDLWEETAGTAARGRLCEAKYLGFRRMREWADVRHQLWDALRGSHTFQLPAHGAAAGEWPLERVHRAVLAGMLGNVLMYDPEQRAYRAAGDRLLHVHPGSALRQRDEGKKGPPSPPWLVACEVVETSRLFARLCAPIDPLWVEALAGERVKRRHRDPQWHPGRAQVVCIETVTWKGLPIRDGRLVPYDRIDAAEAARVFISQALVDDDGIAEPAVVARNRALLTLAAGLKHRLRDPSLEADRTLLMAFYGERLGGAPISRLGDFKRWLADHGEDRLAITLAELTSPEVAAKAEAGAPDTVAMGGLIVPLTYRFLPGDPLDGVTIEIDERQAPLIDPLRLDWLVPAWWPEAVEAHVAQLPKDARRALIPLASSVPRLVEAMRPSAGRRPFAAALADALATLFAVRGAAFDPAALPPYLRPRFVVRSGDGAVVYEGRDPAFLAGAGGADRLRLLVAEWATEPAAVWPGDLPPAGGKVEYGGITGWVALGRGRAADGSVAFRRAVYASREAAQAWHLDGLEAGLEAHFSGDLERLALAPAPGLLAARCEKSLALRLGALRRHLAVAVLIEHDLAAVRDRAGWEALLARVAPTIPSVTDLDALITRIVTAAENLVARRKQGAKSLGTARAAASVGLVGDRLLASGWSTRLPWSALRRMDVFLTAQADRLKPGAAADQRAIDRIAALFATWDEVMSPDPGRLLVAIGAARTVRGLWASLHECCCALSAANPSGAQAAEMRVRVGLDELEGSLCRERDRIAETRHLLLETSRLVERIKVAERRTRIAREVTEAIRDFPDLGIGADLPGQHSAARALVARVRASL